MHKKQPRYHLKNPSNTPTYQSSNLMMLQAFGSIGSNINRTLITNCSTLILPNILGTQNPCPRTCTILIKFTPIPWIGWTSCYPRIVLILHGIHTCIVRDHLGISRPPIGCAFGIVIEIRLVRVQRGTVWTKCHRYCGWWGLGGAHGCLERWLQGRRCRRRRSQYSRRLQC
jgi:hypothetical protein